jgi:hypothetical protein
MKFSNKSELILATWKLWWQSTSTEGIVTNSFAVIRCQGKGALYIMRLCMSLTERRNLRFRIMSATQVRTSCLRLGVLTAVCFPASLELSCCFSVVPVNAIDRSYLNEGKTSFTSFRLHLVAEIWRGRSNAVQYNWFIFGRPRYDSQSEGWLLWQFYRGCIQFLQAESWGIIFRWAMIITFHIVPCSLFMVILPFNAM